MTSKTHTQLLTTPLVVLLLHLLTFQTPKTIASSPPQNQPFTKIYAFGDSYTDTGNTLSTTGGPSGSLPYGMTYFHHPTNRYSDGRLVIDFVAEHLSLPLTPPYKIVTNDNKTIDSVNFAVAGATAIEHDFFVKNKFFSDFTDESLGTEFTWFTNVLEKQGCGRGNNKCGALFDDALFWVGEIGANDYAYSTTQSSIDYQRNVVQRLAIKRVSDFLEVIN